MNTELRPIAEQDFEALLALFQEFAFFEKLPEKMTNSLAQMRVEKAYLNGFVALNEQHEIAGYVTFFFGYYTWTGKSLYMDDLYVRPQYRGCGVGTQLIHAVIDFAKAEQCKKLRWQVSEWNQPAIDFYKSLGATIDSVESNCDLFFN
jgi:GNAT superfamily N-acetyltransferase